MKKKWLTRTKTYPDPTISAIAMAAVYGAPMSVIGAALDTFIMVKHLPGATVKMLAAFLGKSDRTVQRDLRHLESLGLIRAAIESDGTVTMRRYKIAESTDIFRAMLSAAGCADASDRDDE